MIIELEAGDQSETEGDVEMKEQKNIRNILDAVETLSHIADLDVDDQMGVVKRHDVEIQGEDITYRTVHWLDDIDGQASLDILRDTYRVILDYLHNFYDNNHRK